MTGYHAQGKGNGKAMLSMGTLANTFTVLFCLVMSFKLCLSFAFMFNHCLLCVVGLMHR